MTQNAFQIQTLPIAALLGIIGAAIVVICIIIAAIYLIKSRNQSGPVCPRCGKPLKPGNHFCTNCGAEIEDRRN